MKIVAQANEHLVSQCMQEESKLIGQESMTAESVHAQMILEGLDEVLGPLCANIGETLLSH